MFFCDEIDEKGRPWEWRGDDHGGRKIEMSIDAEKQT